MPKGSGGGGNGGRSGGGGGSTDGDAGQPGEVVREANKANVIMAGGQVIKPGMTSSQLDAALVGTIGGARGGTPEGRAAQEKFVSAIKKAGIKASDYEPGTSWNSRLNRWLK